MRMGIRFRLALVALVLLALPWLAAQFGREALLFRQVDPGGIAFGLRWCEILLARELDVAQTIQQPPAAIQQWARDITSPD